jgi:hypothetical protein
LLEETWLFNQSCALAVGKARMKKFMELGGQTREGELDLPKMFFSLAEAE